MYILIALGTNHWCVSGQISPGKRREVVKVNQSCGHGIDHVSDAGRKWNFCPRIDYDQLLTFNVEFSPSVQVSGLYIVESLQRQHLLSSGTQLMETASSVEVRLGVPGSVLRRNQDAARLRVWPCWSEHVLGREREIPDSSPDGTGNCRPLADSTAPAPPWLGERPKGLVISDRWGRWWADLDSNFVGMGSPS